MAAGGRPARTPRGGGAGASAPRVLLRRVVAGGVLVAVGVFAVEGGEYGTSDLVTQRRAMTRLAGTVDSLQRVVDSLERAKRAVLTDAEVQERLAREEFGMVRGDTEWLYRFAGPPRDSAPTP